jgi:hypothetical protein
MSQRNSIEPKDALTRRVHEYYLSWEKLDADKMWSLMSHQERGTKEEFLKEWRKSGLRVKKYQIMNIHIVDRTAKVRVELTLLEHGEETTGICFDYWKLRNDEWVLVDAGRSD